MDAGLPSAIIEHCKRFLGPCIRVLEDEAKNPGIDLLEFNPYPEDPITVFVTRGMSDQPMNVPPDVPNPESYRCCELVLCLPGEWPTRLQDLQCSENAWPLQVLESFAYLPSRRNTWVWGGHTLQHAGPYAPDTNLCSAFVCPEHFFDDGFTVLRFPDREVCFLQLTFLYEEELQYTQKNGSDAFMNIVMDSGMSPFEFLVLDKHRRNVLLT